VATIWVRRTPAGFVALDHESLPASWKIGETLRAEVVKPRNGKLHRKAFILLDVVFPHTEYVSKEALRKAMTIGAGYVEEIINPITGEVALAPKSWAFSNMDEFAFRELYSAMIGVALKIVDGSTREDWFSAVEEIARL
jgi:hypothetical protein